MLVTRRHLLVFIIAPTYRKVKAVPGRKKTLFPVALGVLALPVPGIPAHVGQGLLCLPAQDLCALGGVCIAGCDVAGAAVGDDIGHIHVVHFHEGVHHIQHAVARAGAQVEDLASLMLGDVFHGSHMALGQVHHMDIVSHAGAVVGIVVIAVDAELLPAADGYLGDIGHQIVGDTSGVLADQAGLMGADGIEVPQQDHAPFGVCVRDAGEDLLGHVLGPAIGVGAAACPAGLPQGHFVVGGVDRGRGGEDDILHAHFLHDLGQYQGGILYLCTAFKKCDNMVTVVQLVRASDCGSECRGFESLQSPKRKRNFSNDFPLFCYISSFWGD